MDRRYYGVSTATLVRIVIRLRDFKEFGPIMRRAGICYHAKYGTDDDDKIISIDHALKIAFRHWPKFSGNADYPVPSNEHCPERAYDTCEDAWDSGSEYGRNRRELLDFVLDEFESEIKRRQGRSRAVLAH